MNDDEKPWHGGDWGRYSYGMPRFTFVRDKKTVSMEDADGFYLSPKVVSQADGIYICIIGAGLRLDVDQIRELNGHGFESVEEIELPKENCADGGRVYTRYVLKGMHDSD